jgi:hypothetical protein
MDYTLIKFQGYNNYRKDGADDKKGSASSRNILMSKISGYPF